MKYSRRAFLKSTGLSGALLPLVGTDRALAAGPTGLPRRLLIVCWTNGFIMDDWRPKGTETSFTFGETLKPLLPYQSKTIVVDGVGQKAHYEANPGALGWKYDQWWGGHDAMPAVLTGVPLAVYKENDFRPGSESVDQFIATELAKQVTLPFSSLVVGPFPDASAWGTISFKAARTTGITPEGNPWNLHKRLFAGGAMGAAQISRTLLARKSVLDYLGKTLTDFGARLGTEDRMRVETHLQSVRETERELSAALDRPAAACSPPDPGAAFDVSKNIANYPKALRLLSDEVVAAFRCDLARVATMTLTTAGGDEMFFPWLGSEFVGAGDEYPTRQYHDITHNQVRSSDHRRRMIRVGQWFFEQVAHIVKQLADTPEGTGTMLDNTLVAVTNTMGSNHNSKVQPFVLIGNLGGAFATGRYIKTPYDAHNRVLVALANGMGVDGSKFGAPKYASELPGLRAR